MRSAAATPVKLMWIEMERGGVEPSGSTLPVPAEPCSRAEEVG